tara:strand:- start:275 stop:478 length:204 start_codon:yes stop_codon:yes gene_type:complete
MADKILQDLFNAVADDLLRKIQSGEATAAELSVARAFLKDNGIDATPGQSEPLKNLVDSLPFDVDVA